MSKLTFYGKALAVIGVSTVVAVVIINHFQFAISSYKGLLPRAFKDAIARGDVNTVKRYLEKGVDVNTATCGSIENVFHSLFKSDCDKQSPLLHEAVLLGANQEIVKLLIAHGANINARNNREQTVLHVLPLSLLHPSAVFGDGAKMKNVGEVLIAHGANINAQDNEGKTVLESALCPPYDNFSSSPNSGLINFVKLLVDKGAALNVINPQSVCATSLLHQAANFNNGKLVKFALAQGIDVNAKDQAGKTPLHYVHGQEAAAVLIANRATINVKNNAGQTPLETAICLHRSYNLKKEIVRFMLTNGADVNALNPQSICGDRDLSLLNEAVVSDIGELVELVLEQGGNINSSDRNGQTPLHHASQVNAPEAAKILLTNGADINASDDKGNTPLHLAAIHRHPEMIKLLIDRGANVNAVDENGHTPLEEATNPFWYSSPDKPIGTPETQPEGTQQTIELLKRAGGRE